MRAFARKSREPAGTRGATTTIMRIVIASLLVLAACSSDRTDRDEHERHRPEALLTGTLPRHMQNCPSAVATATTSSARASDGVELTITSPDPAAQREIVARAFVHSWQGDPIARVTPHTGKHGGPGSIGFCPIIHADTIVTYSAIPDGVRVHVAARRPQDVPALQQATEARVAAVRARAQPSRSSS